MNNIPEIIKQYFTGINRFELGVEDVIALAKSEHDIEVNSKDKETLRMYMHRSSVGFTNIEQCRMHSFDKIEGLINQGDTYSVRNLMPGLSDEERIELLTLMINTRYTRAKHNSYNNIISAGIAANQLGAVTKSDYMKIKKHDKYLTQVPARRFIQWVDWDSFLVSNLEQPTTSYSVCSMLAKHYQVKSREAYLRLCSDLPHLHSQPEVVFADQWVSWEYFLMPVVCMNNHDNTYDTLEEIRQSVKILKTYYPIHTREDYFKYYRNDPFLVRNPNEHPQYKKQWRGWKSLLNYRDVPMMNYQEAKSLIKRHKITSRRMYESMYKSISKRLPFSPVYYYKTEWEGWEIFLNKSKAVEYEMDI